MALFKYTSQFASPVYRSDLGNFIFVEIYLIISVFDYMLGKHVISSDNNCRIFFVDMGILNLLQNGGGN